MTDKPRLADARRLADAATEGVWINLPQDDGVYIAGACDHVGCHDYPMDHPNVLRIVEDEAVCGMSQEDAEFIAASRTLVPAMEQALRDVLALADKWEQGATRWADPLPVPPEVEQVRAAIAAHLDIEGGSERA